MKISLPSAVQVPTGKADALEAILNIRPDDFYGFLPLKTLLLKIPKYHAFSDNGAIFSNKA